MQKGIVCELVHQKDFMYFKLQPDSNVLHLLDEIESSIDEFDEGPIFLEPGKEYSNIVPLRRQLHDGYGSIHAFVVCNLDQIDLILFKGAKKFKKFLELFRERFEYADGTSI